MRGTDRTPSATPYSRVVKAKRIAMRQTRLAMLTRSIGRSAGVSRTGRLQPHHCASSSSPLAQSHA